MTRLPRIWNAIVIAALAVLGPGSRLDEALGAVFSSGSNPVAGDSHVGKLPGAIPNPWDPEVWKKCSPSPNRAVNLSPNRGSSPLRQIFHDSAQDQFFASSTQQGSDALRACFLPALGPCMAGHGLAAQEGAYLDMESTMPAYEASSSYWISPSVEPVEPRNAQSDSAVAPPRATRAAVPTRSDGWLTADVIEWKPLIIGLPAAIGLTVLIGHVFWRWLHRRRAALSDNAELGWEDESAVSDEQAAPAKFLTNLVRRESHRVARRRAETTAPSKDKETRRAA